MANTVDVTVLEGGFKGARNLVVHVFLQSDGATGELNKQTIVDPAALGLPPTTRFSLYGIHYNLGGFDAIVEFDSGGVTPTAKWALIEGANNPEDFAPFGGIRDTSGINGTGKLQLTTAGFTSTADFGSIVFILRMPTT